VCPRNEIYVDTRIFKPASLAYHLILNMSDSPEQPDKDRSPFKLLLIDDNVQMREMTRFYMQDLADEIRECADGGMAFDAYVDFLPDWVLMEVYLKETDGFAVIRRIAEFYPRARIIVVTNHPDDQTRLAATDAGADAFFGKDDLNALVSFIKTKSIN